MYYRMNCEQDASDIVTQALKWIVNSVSNEPVIKADREKLEHMLSLQMDTACARKSMKVKIPTTLTRRVIMSAHHKILFIC
jgi:hypothetical protein